MLSHDRKRSVMHRLLPENTADKRGNSLTLKSFVTFVPFVVRNSGFILSTFTGNECSRRSQMYRVLFVL